MKTYKTKENFLKIDVIFGKKTKIPIPVLIKMVK